MLGNEFNLRDLLGLWHNHNKKRFGRFIFEQKLLFIFQIVLDYPVDMNEKQKKLSFIFPENIFKNINTTETCTMKPHVREIETEI